jgi:4-amino-4-deoxy-L-arabinose transferase-like glycosyltransferase
MVNLFDWDEINFAECAREMLETKEFLVLQMNFRPFWEKPPFFIWISALSMNFFGINEFTARLPNALCGTITLLFLFNLGRRIYDARMGFIWVMCYACSTLPFFYFKSGIIDPWFNLFVFGGVTSLVLATVAGSRKRGSLLVMGSALLIGMAVLTKGPAAIIIYGLVAAAFLVRNRMKSPLTFGQMVMLVTVILAVSGSWFFILVSKGQQQVIESFISYQAHLIRTGDSGHDGPFYYHVLVLLIGCFPASVFACWGFAARTENNPLQQQFRLWMTFLFWVVLILFSVVKTKIVHYSSLCYFPITFFAAIAISELLRNKLAWKRSLSTLLLAVGGFIALALILLPIAGIYKSLIIHSGLIHDEFTLANLQAAVSWTGFESLIGLLLLAAIIIGCVLGRRQKIRAAAFTILAGNLVAVYLALIVLIPKIELYTQRAAIDFYKSLQGRDCYFQALNYHSYAQYFYSRKKPVKESKSYSTEWLTGGNIDKDAYFVSKITDAEAVAGAYPLLKEMGRKNGFVFYFRGKQRSAE